MDSLGNLEWEKSLGSYGDEEASSIQQRIDGGFIIAGSTETSNEFDVSGNHGSFDFWIVKLSPFTVSTKELNITLKELTIYQDLSELQITFFSKKSSTARLNIFDLKGKNLFHNIINVSQGVNKDKINCANFSRGIYFLEIVSENGTLTKRFSIF